MTAILQTLVNDRFETKVTHVNVKESIPKKSDNCIVSYYTILKSFHFVFSYIAILLMLLYFYKKWYNNAKTGYAFQNSLHQKRQIDNVCVIWLQIKGTNLRQFLQNFAKFLEYPYTLGTKRPNIPNMPCFKGAVMLYSRK